MTPPHDYLAARLRRLTETLVTLKQRVREAVATELGSAIGDAVKDILRALVAGRPSAPLPSRPSSRYGYDPDPDEWEDDEEEPYHRQPTNEIVLDPAGSSIVPQAIAVGVAAAHWAVTKKAPAWAGVGVGLLAAFAAWCGGPALAAGLAVADLLALGHQPILSR
jgi:hypothetical protein